MAQTLVAQKLILIFKPHFALITAIGTGFGRTNDFQGIRFLLNLIGSLTLFLWTPGRKCGNAEMQTLVYSLTELGLEISGSSLSGTFCEFSMTDPCFNIIGNFSLSGSPSFRVLILLSVLPEELSIDRS